MSLASSQHQSHLQPPSPIPCAADPPNLRERFRRFAAWTATAAGAPWTFIFATCFLIAWGLSYPLFLRFSNPFDTWQLVINTVTTIVTFLMVFLIQNTQNRDARAIHLKLDELIRAMKGARNRLVELENCTDEELEALKAEFERIRQRSTGSGRAQTDQQINRINQQLDQPRQSPEPGAKKS